MTSCIAVSKEVEAGKTDFESLKTPEQTAKWLGIAERTLLNNARRKRIPCVRINQRVLRFHLPSVLAALQ
jgi:hypothetical protein